MIPPIPSVQRLRRGLQGYLIPFAPHAFEHERQILSSKLPSPSVFLPISAHFTATPEIPLASPRLQIDSFRRKSEVKPRHFTPNIPFRLRSLYAQ